MQHLYTDRRPSECRIDVGQDRYPFQIFNGKKYFLYNGERYYSKANKRLHVVVYEYYYGKVPKGYHVHHKDENRANNHPLNLELLDGSEHMSLHMQKRDKEELKKRFDYARTFANKWHGSEEGRRRHRQQAIETGFLKLQEKNIPKNCEHCGKEYLASHCLASTSRFCSNVCKSKWRRDAGLDNITANCIVCGSPFIKNKYSKVQTCTRSCAAHFQWRTKKTA